MARSLFPFPLAAYQLGGAPKQEPPKQGGAQQVGSRRGFMGAFQRKSLPRTLQVIGATMQQMDNPAGQLDQFAADEMRQRAIAMAERAQERTAQQEKTQQGAMEEAIALLPPQQQAWARLAPDAAARGMFGPPAARYGDLERIDGRLGQRNQVTGQYHWAPQVTDYGTRMQPGMPVSGAPGYVWGQNGGMQPAEGGPADVRQTAEGRARLQQMESSERQLQNAVDVLADALPNVGGGTAGLFADATRNWGLNQGSTDLNEALEPVRAILSFESLAEMRRNSATGGALGSIAVRELELLGNTVRSLSVRQSPEQLRANIVATRAQLERTLRAVRAAREEMLQGPGDAPMEPPAPEDGQGQDRVLQWSPERGVY